MRQERDYGRYDPAPVYEAPQVAYQPYYEPRYDSRYEPQYEPRRVVYVQPPVYESYPVIYAGYRTPVYYERHAYPRRVHYASRHEYYDHRRGY